jgi:hypothetical protein
MTTELRTKLHDLIESRPKKKNDRPGDGRPKRKKDPPPPEDDSFFSSKEWAAIFEQRLRDYGPVVRELYGPNGKIRKFYENNRSEAIANQQKISPSFRLHFSQMKLEWWPSDFLRVAGPIAWNYKPFWEGVRLIHDTALSPGRGNQSPVLLPGLTPKSRLKIADYALPWDEFKQLPVALQGVRLGWSPFPLSDTNGGNYDEAFHEAALQAQEELGRFLKIESDLLREARKRPHANIRHLRNLRLFEWLREEGKSWIEAEEQLATQQGLTRSAIHGDIQSAMRLLGLSKEGSRPRATRPRNSRKPGRDED